MLPSLPPLIGSLKDITTNTELQQYLNSPGLAETFPTEHDRRQFIARVYSKDVTMNWCHSLDHVNVTRAVSRNYGTNGSTDGTSVFAKAEMEDVPVVLLGLPTPEALFNHVWE